MQDQIRTVIAIVTCVALLVGCSQKSATGTYVGKFSDAAVLLEVVQTADGRLTGKYIQLQIRETGALESFSAPISGVVDDSLLSLELHPTAPLAPSLTVSGALHNNSIKLQFEASESKIETQELKLAPVSEFEAHASKIRELSTTLMAQVAETRRQAQEAAANAKREADVRMSRANAVRDIDAVLRSASAFNVKYEEYLPRFTKVEKRYNEITEKMQAMLERERQTNSSFGRGQISFQIDGATGFSGPTESAHGNVQSLKSEHASERKTVVAEILRLQSLCQSIEGYESNFINACTRLFADRKRFDNLNERMDAAFDKAEGWYQAAKKKQAVIAEEAKRLEE